MRRRASEARTSSRASFILATLWVEDVDGVGAALADHPQIGLPHVRADELDAVQCCLADQVEELLETLHGPILADPEQADAALLDLVDQGQIGVALAILDLVDPDRLDGADLAVFEPPGHDIFDRLADLVPAGAEGVGGFLP